jgi:hypothetical protein
MCDHVLSFPNLCYTKPRDGKVSYRIIIPQPMESITKTKRQETENANCPTCRRQASKSTSCLSTIHKKQKEGIMSYLGGLLGFLSLASDSVS